MRILLITPYFHPHKGGSQQYAEELCYHLMKVNKDINVDVITYNTDTALAKEKYRGMNVYRVPCIQILPGQFAIPNYWYLWKLLKKLNKEHQYTLINSHTRFFENSWWTPFVAKHFNIKSVLTDHCANHPTHTSRIVNFITAWVDKIIAPFISKKYDMVTVTNKSTQAFVKSLHMKESELVYGGVDTTYFSPADKTNPRKIPTLEKIFTQENIIVTFVGRMIHSKGPHILFESIQDIIKEYPQLHVVFAGGGEMLDKLSSVNTNERVHFLGSCEKEQVAAIMSVTDILVHPSTHHEGFPNVLLEAGASGCTIIATDMGGTKEIIIDKETGLMVEPNAQAINKALRLLLKDVNLRNTLAKNLTRHIKTNFEWENIAKQFDKLIKAKIINSN